jgi:hypothetical protein
MPEKILEEEECKHDIQNHNTSYGSVYWCNKCWKTPEEIRQEREEKKHG